MSFAVHIKRDDEISWEQNCEVKGLFCAVLYGDSCVWLVLADTYGNDMIGQMISSMALAEYSL